MAGTPNTLGVVLLFAAVFFGGIWWATGGHTSDADPEEQDVLEPGKMS